MNIHFPVGNLLFVVGGMEMLVFGSSCCCCASVETHVFDAIDVLYRRLMCQSPNHLLTLGFFPLMESMGIACLGNTASQPRFVDRLAAVCLLYVDSD